MFFSSKKSILGIDIGTTNIKIAQITSKDNVHTLETYGLVNAAFDIDETKEESIAKTVLILKNLIEKSGVSTNKVVASLPNSAVFTSVIDLPPLKDSELKAAIEFEAKKYVPLPITEMTLSWSVIEKMSDGKTRILLTAVPNNVLRSYLKIFQQAKLEPVALEIEALALIRALIGDDKGSILIVDVGAKSTHLNIVENGNLLLTRNIPMGGDTITQKIAESLKISLVRAEQFKKDFGLTQSNLIPENIKPILANIKSEAKQLQGIYQARGKKFDKIMIVGGTANLPGLNEFFSDMDAKIVNGDPLSKLTFPADLKPVISQYAENLSVAIGLALRAH
ncbi:MAG: type IV pilus assembly protein PilM [Candidatus Doudnabacteria bacterium Gr01-1014_77]|uniref:Type IV pilus assembly protein PilM n=1 Tax=Candidatus Doudnabacteria bacterium Gr01-1014_77 TaxID=2017133 RepID=A0A554JDT0_9BACT|nr:MAG: type IV pilus assembly protein PilM [Candidatus Doudnabacteria bacterium Gr01-1014_77]